MTIAWAGHFQDRQSPKAQTLALGHPDPIPESLLTGWWPQVSNEALLQQGSRSGSSRACGTWYLEQEAKVPLFPDCPCLVIIPATLPPGHLSAFHLPCNPHPQLDAGGYLWLSQPLSLAVGRPPCRGPHGHSADLRSLFLLPWLQCPSPGLPAMLGQGLSASQLGSPRPVSLRGVLPGLILHP